MIMSIYPWAVKVNKHVLFCRQTKKTSVGGLQQPMLAYRHISWWQQNPVGLGKPVLGKLSNLEGLSILPEIMLMHLIQLYLLEIAP